MAPEDPAPDGEITLRMSRVGATTAETGASARDQCDLAIKPDCHVC